MTDMHIASYTQTDIQTTTDRHTNTDIDANTKRQKKRQPMKGKHSGNH